MVKRVIITINFLTLIFAAFSQHDTVSYNQNNNKRLWFVAGANAALWTGSFVALNKAWYADYPRTKFHFFNDNAEWNQVDKAGHLWWSYQVSRISAEAWKWAGLSANTSAILGGTSGIIYQSIIEIQDAYSSEWGFSWGDMGCNLAGAGLYVLQETQWKEHRMQLKLSYWPKDYPGDLMRRRDQLFGSSGMERILKDYNSQTYWLSANISSFIRQSRVPKWLNISLGYGASGLYGGMENIWTDKEGTRFDYSNIKRERKFYLAPDVDFTCIHTNKKWLRSVFFMLNMVKIPAPAVELNNSGKISLRAIKF